MLHAEVLRGALRAPVQVGGPGRGPGRSRRGVGAPGRRGGRPGPAAARRRRRRACQAHARRRPAPTTRRWTSTAPNGSACSPTWRGRSPRASCSCTTSPSATWAAGCSASRRWCAGSTRERGLLPPLSSCPVAERTGLVHPLTESVLDLALAQARTWCDEGREVPVAVNISTRSLLQPGFAEQVLAALGIHGVRGGAARAGDHRDHDHGGPRPGSRGAEPAGRGGRPAVASTTSAPGTPRWPT